MRLARVDVVPLRLPLARVLTLPRGASRSLEEGKRLLLVRAETDDGRVGWGEASPSRRWSAETLESARAEAARLSDLSVPPAEYAAWQARRLAAPAFAYLPGVAITAWQGSSQGFLWPWFLCRLWVDLAGLFPHQREVARREFLGSPGGPPS